MDEDLDHVVSTESEYDEVESTDIDMKETEEEETTTSSSSRKRRVIRETKS